MEERRESKKKKKKERKRRRWRSVYGGRGVGVVRCGGGGLVDCQKKEVVDSELLSVLLTILRISPILNTN